LLRYKDFVPCFVPTMSDTKTRSQSRAHSRFRGASRCLEARHFL